MDLCVALCVYRLIQQQYGSHTTQSTHTQSNTQIQAQSLVHSKQDKTYKVSTNKHINIYYSKKFIYN
jgi:hypothetical protein